MSSARKIVVTGATGHVGTNLLRELRARGEHPVAVVHDDPHALEGMDVAQVRGDVLDRASLEQAFEGADLVFHLAARISIDAADDALVLETNTRGPANVAAACMATGVRRLVHFSSIHAFSAFPLNETVDETRAPTSESYPIAYDRSKAMGERAILAAVERGLDAVIVNPTAVLGPYDFRPSPMGEVLLKLFRGRLPALVQGGFDWVDVRDVVAGALVAAERGRRGERYLLSGAWTTVSDLLGTAARIARVRAPRIVMPASVALAFAPVMTAWSKFTGSRPLYTRASIEILQRHRSVSHAKAERELGYTARPLRATLEDTYAWLRDSGRL